MRIKLLLFLSAAFVVNAKAQITITASDVYVPGKVHSYNGADLGTIELQAGASGADVIWDFSDLQADPEQAVEIAHLSPDQTPFATEYPNCTMALDDDTIITYFQVTESALKLIGISNLISDKGNELAMWIHFKFEPSIVHLQFPMAYGNTGSSTGIHYQELTSENEESPIPFPIQMDLRLASQMTNKFIADGYGTLITPHGEYETLRILSYSTMSSWMEVKVGGSWEHAMSLTEDSLVHAQHSWWAKGIGSEVMVIEYADSLAMQPISVHWHADVVTGTHKGAKMLTSTLSPNPSNGNFTLELGQDIDAHTLQVLDARGNVVYTKAFTRQVFSHDLSFLNDGLYTVNLRSDKGYTTQKLVIRK